jgi:hypothetical protein
MENAHDWCTRLWRDWRLYWRLRSVWKTDVPFMLWIVWDSTSRPEQYTTDCVRGEGDISKSSQYFDAEFGNNRAADVPVFDFEVDTNIGEKLGNFVFTGV